MELAGYLEAMMEQGAGDLHLQAESPPRIRVAGQLKALDTPPLSDDQIREIMRQMAFEDAQVRLDQERSVDFSFEMPGRARSGSTPSTSGTACRWRSA